MRVDRMNALGQRPLDARNPEQMEEGLRRGADDDAAVTGQDPPRERCSKPLFSAPERQRQGPSEYHGESILVDHEPLSTL